VREALLKSLLDYLRHASHEWSAPIILWGMDGATLDQCDEIMSEVILARELDREGAYALSIDGEKAQAVPRETDRHVR
jgi:hypothetical protein